VLCVLRHRRSRSGQRQIEEMHLDNVKLKKCTACKLVRYCSVACQRVHRPQHKRACKKRVAELREELLFQQPESDHNGDCPICLLPLSIHPRESTIMPCCSKLICNGCDYANHMHELQGSLESRCPFCRQPIAKTQEAVDLNVMKKIEANDVPDG
jgi:hypothetical protein